MPTYRVNQIIRIHLYVEAEDELDAKLEAAETELGEWLFDDTLEEDIKPVKEEKRIATMTLQAFVEHTTNEDTPSFNLFRTADGYEVCWERTTYSGDREGFDHFTVYQQGDLCEIEHVTMDREVDEAHLFDIAHAIGVFNPEIEGTVTWEHPARTGGVN